MTESARCLIIKLHDENEMYIGTYDGGNRNDITFNARSLSSTSSCVLLPIIVSQYIVAEYCAVPSPSNDSSLNTSAMFFFA